MELIVAMVIFGVIAGACWALLDAGHGVSKRGQYYAARMQTARAAIRAIEQDLRGIYSGTSTYDIGLVATSAGTDEKPLDTLAIVTFANQPPGVAKADATFDREMDLIKITYSIDEDSRTDQEGLVRERLKRITESITVKEPGLYIDEIARDVIYVNFRYYDGGSWLDTWDSTLSGTVPKMIEATVHVRNEWRGTEEIEKFTTRVWLPIAATAPAKTQ